MNAGFETEQRHHRKLSQRTFENSEMLSTGSKWKTPESASAAQLEGERSSGAAPLADHLDPSNNANRVRQLIAPPDRTGNRKNGRLSVREADRLWPCQATHRAPRSWQRRPSSSAQLEQNWWPPACFCISVARLAVSWPEHVVFRP